MNYPFIFTAEVTSEEVHSNISILTERSGVANSNNSTMHDRRFTVQINYSRFDVSWTQTRSPFFFFTVSRSFLLSFTLFIYSLSLQLFEAKLIKPSF